MSGENLQAQVNESQLAGRSQRSTWSWWPRQWRWILGVASLIALPVTLARITEYEGNVFGLLISFLPWFLPVAVIGFICALLSRSYIAVIVALACLICNVIWFIPYVTTAQMSSPANPNLVIMSMNTTKGQANLETVEHLAKDNKVDFLLLQEVTRAFSERLNSSRLNQQFPYRLGESSQDQIFSKTPLDGLELTPPGLAGSIIGAKTSIGDETVTLVNVHPAAPLSINHKGWNSDHPLMIDLLRNIQGPVIVAGDFNATSDHKVMREFAAMGYSDVAVQAGNARDHTYPNGRKVPFPMVTIDHVLYRDLTISELASSTYKVDGADHRALIVKLKVDGTE